MDGINHESSAVHLHFYLDMEALAYVRVGVGMGGVVKQDPFRSLYICSLV